MEYGKQTHLQMLYDKNSGVPSSQAMFCSLKHCEINVDIKVLFACFYKQILCYSSQGTELQS